MTSDPRIEGFLRAISLHTGIPYDELAELYSVRRGKGSLVPERLTVATNEPASREGVKANL